MRTIRESIEFVLGHFLAAKKQPLKNNPVAKTIREQCARAILLASRRTDYLTKGAPGEGAWSEVPWIGLFNPEVTDSASTGVYIVYLFNADMSGVSISIAQGVTAVRQEFGRSRRRELLRRAELIRDRVPEHKGRFVAGPASFGGTTSLARDYNDAVIFHRAYVSSALPTENDLSEDLQAMAQLYELAIARGGADNLETANSLSDQVESVDETRRYVRHLRIERSSKAAKEAKKHQGFVCKACGFDFAKAYGERGVEFIEAHHLFPLSTLPVGEPVPMNPERDFAVLCSNCHRMVHRRRPWLEIDELRALLRAPNRGQ